MASRDGGGTGGTRPAPNYCRQTCQPGTRHVSPYNWDNAERHGYPSTPLPGKARSSTMTSAASPFAFGWGCPSYRPNGKGGACPLCGQTLDILGDHMVCCNKNQLKHRHSVIQGAIAELAQLAGIPVAMEVALRDVSVPGDVCFRQWDADGPLMVDITCRHPTPVGSAPPPVDGLAAWFASQA